MQTAATVDEQMHAPAWPGWLLMAGLAGVCLFLGELVGRLAGFPYFEGFQGVLVQQPISTRLIALAGVLVVGLLSLRITVAWTRPMDSRLGVALSALVITGLSIRAGGMRSVMQAAGGREVFWLLAAESAGLLLVVWVIFAGRFVMGSSRRIPKEKLDLEAAGVQALLFAVGMWVLGCSTVKAQGICSVLASGVISGFFTHLIIGRNWRGSWCIPLVVAILGFVANAVSAGGVDIAKLSGPVCGLATATPLDYAGVGAIGMIIGEMLSSEHRPAQSREGLIDA